MLHKGVREVKPVFHFGGGLRSAGSATQSELLPGDKHNQIICTRVSMIYRRRNWTFLYRFFRLPHKSIKLAKQEILALTNHIVGLVEWLKIQLLLVAPKPRQDHLLDVHLAERTNVFPFPPSFEKKSRRLRSAIIVLVTG